MVQNHGKIEARTLLLEMSYSAFFSFRLQKYDFVPEITMEFAVSIRRLKLLPITPSMGR